MSTWVAIAALPATKDVKGRSRLVSRPLIKHENPIDRSLVRSRLGESNR